VTRHLLAVAYGGGHVTMAIPIIKELQRRGGWEVTVLGLTTAGPVLEAAGIPFLGFKDLMTPADLRAREIGAALAEREHTPGKGIPLEESIAYLGLSYADLEARLGRDEARAAFAARGRRAFVPFGPLERLVDRASPDVVLTTGAPRAEEAAIRVARRRSIPSVIVHDLFGLESANDYLYERGFGDVVTVIADTARNNFVERGRLAEEIRITGNPAFDGLADPGLAVRAVGWRHDRGLEDRPVILWASQPEPPDPDLLVRVRRAIVAAAERHHWWVLHRPHPNEAPPDPLDPAVGHAGREDDLGVVLHAADVVVVLTTTVGLEAALVGKPVVQIRLSHYDYSMPYERMGLALNAPDLASIEPAIERALHDDAARSALAAARARLPAAGGATARVADVIESLA
jgi:hypothetical protein